MATTQRSTIIRKAVSVGAVAIAATLVGASSPVASAAAINKTSATTVTSLDTPANWAIVRQAAASGYAVSSKLSASCGALQ